MLFWNEEKEELNEYIADFDKDLLGIFSKINEQINTTNPVEVQKYLEKSKLPHNDLYMEEYKIE